jgi:orotate phosphoribosyltransferase
MTAAASGAATARLLLAAGAIAVSRERPFILAAGWASPVYVDCRLLIGRPDWARAITDLAVGLIGTEIGAAGFDMVAGAETAGIAFAAWIAERLDRPLRYVRRRPLGIGRHAQVEGGRVDGARVLLIDDLATDAASKAAFVRGLREAGATVSEAVVIFAHGTFPGTAARLDGLGLRLHALATWPDVLALAAAEPGLLDPADRARIDAFRADPVGWSAVHGGRAEVAPGVARPGG